MEFYSETVGDDSSIKTRIEVEFNRIRIQLKEVIRYVDRTGIVQTSKLGLLSDRIRENIIRNDPNFLMST